MPIHAQLAEGTSQPGNQSRGSRPGEKRLYSVATFSGVRRRAMIADSSECRTVLASARISNLKKPRRANIVPHISPSELRVSPAFLRARKEASFHCLLPRECEKQDRTPAIEVRADCEEDDLVQPDIDLHPVDLRHP